MPLSARTKKRLEKKSIKAAMASRVPSSELKGANMFWEDKPVESLYGISYHLTIRDKMGRTYDVLFDVNTHKLESFSCGFET